ncbi:MAG: hypothetical protein QOH80_1944 [Actinomycetota bacterium]|nr:hypothetical protein [Actinomycetota bacterium]
MTDTNTDPSTSRDDSPSFDRRSLLRTGSALLAGVAGAATLGVVGAPGANAVTGAPVLLGTANDGGATETSLTGTANPTFGLINSGGAAPLNLESASFDFGTYAAASASGDLVNQDGTLLFSHATDAVGGVYTDVWANMLIPLVPQRAVDTRGAGGRVRIVNPVGNLDSQGRLISGHTIEIDLESDYVFGGVAGFFNLTSVASVGGGYLTLWPSGTKPSTSSLNFQKGVAIANGLVCGLSDVDSVQIFASATTHVILDLMAVFAGWDGQVNPLYLPGSAPFAAGKTAKAAPRRAPAWARARG